MNCSRCQTELPDTATYCTTCGASTRMSVPSTFSYLPPGTPPWPSTVPSGFSYKPNAALPTPTMSKAMGAKAKAKFSTRGLLLSASLLLLAVVLGAGATLGTLYANGKLDSSTNTQVVTVPTPVPTAGANAATPSTGSNSGTPTSNQLPTPTAFQKANNTTNLGVVLKYPSNWTEEALQTSTTSNFVRLRPQQANLRILFIIERFSASTSSTFNSATELNNGLLQSLSNSQSISNLQPVQQGTQQRSIGGTNWAEQDAMYTDSGGNKTRLTTISVEHNKLYYNILIISADTYYTEAMQKYIQPMFDSLQFLS